MGKAGLIGGLTALALFSTSASAAPDATLTFATPSANVQPTDVIPVFVTLTLNSGPALSTDSTGAITSGFVAGDLPDNFAASFSYVSMSQVCSGTFTINTAPCDGPPYNFDFHRRDALSLVFPSNLNVDPGTPSTFQFGTFTPSHGPVAEGTYTFFDARLFMVFVDESRPDPQLSQGPANTSWEFVLPIANTCDGEQIACSFQRTVVTAVPEPETYAMLLVGLGMIGWVARRRSRA